MQSTGPSSSRASLTTPMNPNRGWRTIQYRHRPVGHHSRLGTPSGLRFRQRLSVSPRSCTRRSPSWAVAPVALPAGKLVREAKLREREQLHVRSHSLAPPCSARWRGRPGATLWSSGPWPRAPRSSADAPHRPAPCRRDLAGRGSIGRPRPASEEPPPGRPRSSSLAASSSRAAAMIIATWSRMPAPAATSS